MPVLHTVAVKATNPGGRLYDGIHTTETRKNGEFGFLGEYIAGSHQVREFKAPGADGGSKMPVVIMQPEMMYDNSRQSLLKLSNWEIEPNTAFCCVPLQSGDKFDITKDALRNTAGAAIPNETDLVVGRKFILTADNFTLKATGREGQDAAAGAAGSVYFEIVKIKDAHARSARINGTFAKDNYKLYTLEVRVK